jgi:Na+-transporting NADH:ubiquinone oxidoreductase subunit A
VRRSPDLNRSWTVDPQAVLDIARLLSSGRYPVEHVAAVGGPGAAAPTHLRVRRGSPLEQLARAAGAPMTGVRLIRGGVFRGRAATAGDGLGFLDHALTILPEGNRREFLALFKPGFETPSYSRAFASRLRRAPLGADCNRHGGLRACIACGHCNAVCPVEILPQLAFKAVLARETEEALRHGLLDCVECGLCAFVCPAKIELLTVLQAAKADYRRELEGR